MKSDLPHTRHKDAKQRHLTHYVDASGKNISHEMIKKIESEMGRKIYPQRIAIVEPVFANIRTHDFTKMIEPRLNNILNSKNPEQPEIPKEFLDIVQEMMNQ